MNSRSPLPLLRRCGSAAEKECAGQTHGKTKAVLGTVRAYPSVSRRPSIGAPRPLGPERTGCLEPVRADGQNARYAARSIDLAAPPRFELNNGDEARLSLCYRGAHAPADCRDLLLTFTRPRSRRRSRSP